MSRVQLAINVSNVDEAVAFYSKLFAAEPHKRRPGYANFALSDPPLKLVLVESTAAAGQLNHLGVEVASSAEVQRAHARLSEQGVDTATEEQVDCCYAVQDKVWVEDPDGAPWEIYTVLVDSDVPAGPTLRADGGCGAGACAGGDPLSAKASACRALVEG